MKDQLHTYSDQFTWEATIENGESLQKDFTRYVLCGMGGSALGARLLLAQDPSLPLAIHSSYGIPPLARDANASVLASTLFILSSYSGETEEVLDAVATAISQDLSVCIVTTGGTLAALAREHSLPLMLIPHGEIEPRMAIGYTMLALTSLMHLDELDSRIRTAGLAAHPDAYRTEGESIASAMQGTIPFIYSSENNAGIAYFWKIAFNETSKIPSSSNVMPEICHNELSGFDASTGNSAIIHNTYPLFISDDADHPRIKARMTLMQALLSERGIPFASTNLSGASFFEKAFGSILAGVWAAITLAEMYGVPDAKTPLIAEFKKRLHDIPV